MRSRYWMTVASVSFAVVIIPLFFLYLVFAAFKTDVSAEVHKSTKVESSQEAPQPERIQLTEEEEEDLQNKIEAAKGKKKIVSKSKDLLAERRQKLEDCIADYGPKSYKYYCDQDITGAERDLKRSIEKYNPLVTEMKENYGLEVLKERAPDLVELTPDGSPMPAA